MEAAHQSILEAVLANPSPVVAAILSVIAVVTISIITYTASHRRQIRPVLIFAFRDSAACQIENVGNGPAMNIVLGHGDSNKRWHVPTGYYPLAKDGVAKII